MSVLQYPEGLEAKDLQIWNNQAFDNGDFSEEKPCWSPLKPISLHSNLSSESFSSKENQIPLLEETNSSVSSIKSPGPLKPINQSGAIEISMKKMKQANVDEGFVKKGILKSFESRDEKEIDKEIEEIEMEISRLSSRLETLRIEKLERSVKTVEKRGRIVPAKFMESNQSRKNTEEKKKIEENLSINGKTKVQRRGLSVGPMEIIAGSRRGMSLGPSEIASGIKSRQSGKQEILTPVQPIQSRRKSCFWKLQDIKEEKVTKERGKSLSPSPKSRKFIPKNQVMRQAVTTIGSKKAVKKDDGVLNSVQPKKLFKDGEKSVNVANKKPLRQGRVIASRYNQSSNQVSAVRKRSLPENDKDESNRCDKKRSLSAEKMRASNPEKESVCTESRKKKQWEIPNEIVIHRNIEDQKSPQCANVVHSLLPSLRIARCTKESPRDSGPAKRVADLVGRKSFFSVDEEVEPSVCQALSFAEEEIPRLRIARCIKESPRDSGPAKRVADLVGRKSFFSIDEEEEQPVCQALSFAEEETFE